MSTPSSLRARLAALPLDRAPLRRAGLLSLLLIALLAAGKAFGPGRPAAASTLADRNEATAPAEGVSASRPNAPASRSAWTGGRVLAVVLLAAGGGIALVLHRRRPAAGAGTAAALGVIETRPLGPNQSLQLVACADEVLLLAVGAEGTTLLRHWPRAHFDADAPTLDDAVSAAPRPSAPDADVPSFAEVLAAVSDAAPAAPASAPRPAAPPGTVPPGTVPPSPAPSRPTSPAGSIPASPAAPSAPPPTDRSWGLHQFGSAHA
jgi:flagellar biogenesis protein FliO